MKVGNGFLRPVRAGPRVRTTEQELGRFRGAAARGDVHLPPLSSLSPTSPTQVPSNAQTQSEPRVSL